MNNNDELLFHKYSWKQVIKASILLLVVYALLGTFFIKAPFAFYTVRASSLNYSRIFFIHGLTVGFAGITGLFVANTFDLKSIIKKINFYAMLVTIFVGITGGAINRSMKYKFTLWYQILSMFALDVILISLFIGFILARKKLAKRPLSALFGFMSVTAAMIAGLFGDLAGFILDFGNWPGICGWYAHQIGFTLSQWQDALIRTHSDVMVVSVLCMLLAIVNWAYGLKLSEQARKIQKFALSWMILGIILMLVVYVVSGIGGSGLQLPHLFTEKGLISARGHSVSGIDLGDFIIGIFILLGGILDIGALAFGAQEISQRAKITLKGIFVVLFCIVLTVAGMGMFEEYRADLYNSDVLTTPLGDFGFAFRLLHVNVALLLFPAIILLMIFAKEINMAQIKPVQYLFRVGTLLSWIACWLFMILNPKFTLANVAMWILDIGLICIIIAILIIVFSRSDRN